MTDTTAKTDILGICTAIGRDVGFHPDILRVALAFGLFVNAGVTVAVYAALGLVVLGSRLLYPDPAVRPATVVALPAPAAAPIADGPGDLRRAA